jgi:hypothetical protein
LNLPRRWDDSKFGRHDNTQNNANGYDQAQLGISQLNTFLLQNTSRPSQAGAFAEGHVLCLELQHAHSQFNCLLFCFLLVCAF